MTFHVPYAGSVVLSCPTVLILFWKCGFPSVSKSPGNKLEIPVFLISMYMLAIPASLGGRQELACYQRVERVCVQCAM